jgi:hypothetical protein
VRRFFDGGIRRSRLVDESVGYLPMKFRGAGKSFALRL